MDCRSFLIFYKHQEIFCSHWRISCISTIPSAILTRRPSQSPALGSFTPLHHCTIQPGPQLMLSYPSSVTWDTPNELEAWLYRG